ncbi:MAG: hypothetical protein DME04_22310 [Candidatus Rokuibacteriota bacterium]|nr:MAG: hypothetical protein DME04_22310 [Candidatus Rokubacteria bacterium]
MVENTGNAQHRRAHDLSESTANWNDFIDVDFSSADLSRADLRASIFERVSFRRTVLRGADLRRAKFRGCIFTDGRRHDKREAHPRIHLAFPVVTRTESRC